MFRLPITPVVVLLELRKLFAVCMVLVDELAGYAAYTVKVRYRLIPGIGWLLVEEI